MTYDAVDCVLCPCQHHPTDVNHISVVTSDIAALFAPNCNYKLCITISRRKILVDHNDPSSNYGLAFVHNTFVNIKSDEPNITKTLSNDVRSVSRSSMF